MMTGKFREPDIPRSFQKRYHFADSFLWRIIGSCFKFQLFDTYKSDCTASPTTGTLVDLDPPGQSIIIGMSERIHVLRAFAFQPTSKNHLGEYAGLSYLYSSYLAYVEEMLGFLSSTKSEQFWSLATRWPPCLIQTFVCCRVLHIGRCKAASSFGRRPFAKPVERYFQVYLNTGIPNAQNGRGCTIVGNWLRSGLRISVLTIRELCWGKCYMLMKLLMFCLWFQNRFWTLIGLLGTFRLVFGLVSDLVRQIYYKGGADNLWIFGWEPCEG